MFNGLLIPTTESSPEVEKYDQLSEECYFHLLSSMEPVCRKIPNFQTFISPKEYFDARDATILSDPPEGLLYFKDFLTRKENDELYEELEKHFQNTGFKRFTPEGRWITEPPQDHYISDIFSKRMMEHLKDMPYVCKHSESIRPFTVNVYGVNGKNWGIEPHFDNMFASEVVALVSIAKAPAVIRYKHIYKNEFYDLIVEPGSLYIQYGAARYLYNHAIADTNIQEAYLPGQAKKKFVQKGLRFSIVFSNMFEPKKTEFPYFSLRQHSNIIEIGSNSMFLMLKVVHNLKNFNEYVKCMRKILHDYFPKFARAYEAKIIELEDVANRIDPQKVCSNCSKSNCSSRCSRCKKVFYCSRTCQVEHWPSHKLVCKKE